jgi:anaerobic dimethyl sulfoxide reductase subunit B (iron-sulfur subunit)
MVAQYGFYFNANECIGCRTCVMACKDKNDAPFGEKNRRVYDYGGGTWEVDANGVSENKDFFIYYLSESCNHCAAPACIAVCAVEAIIKREDGIVYIDPEVCIGCGACVPACPFGAPYLSEVTGVAKKCDFCLDLIDEGEEPFCVRSCSMRCLKFGELADLQAEYGTLDTYPPMPSNAGTGPSVVITPCRLNPDASLPGAILNAPEEIISETNVV